MSSTRDTKKAANTLPLWRAIRDAMFLFCFLSARTMSKVVLSFSFLDNCLSCFCLFRVKGRRETAISVSLRVVIRQKKGKNKTERERRRRERERASPSSSPLRGRGGGREEVRKLQASLASPSLSRESFLARRICRRFFTEERDNGRTESAYVRKERRRKRREREGERGGLKRKKK